MASIHQNQKQDKEDLEAARADPGDPVEDRPWYKTIGPGLVTGAADDDPSGVGTYSANGAQFGYVLLWLVPVCIPLMIAVQEMCGRVAAITGSGLAAVIKKNYPKSLLYSCVLLLMAANLFNVYADLNMMAASAHLLLGVPQYAGVAVFTVLLILTQVMIPYRIYVRGLKWLCISLLGYAVVALMPGVHNNWASVASSIFVPRMDFKTDTILAIVAFLGTTISPYLFFWQAGETVEEEVVEGKADRPGKRTKPVSEQEIRSIRADTAVGMIVSQVVALFIIVAAAGTLHASGKIHIDSAHDAAMALKPLGPIAYTLFSVCMVATGLLAVPTLAGSAAYSLAETFGWRYGLYRRFQRAKGFYLTVTAMILLGGILNFIGVLSPIKALVYSAALNGVVAPPLIIVLLLICNNKKIMGKRTNGVWSNIFSWITVACMGPAAIFLIYSMFAGKA